jgi:putative NADH-flavin reductase
MSAVLIIGASRGIGLEAVRLALKAGHSVRALARSASAIRLRDPRLEKLDGDALDREMIERALEGVHVVIQSLGVSPTPELIFSGTRLFSNTTRVLVDAMQARAVRRLICVTGLGAGDSRGHGGLSEVATGKRSRRYKAQFWFLHTALVRGNTHEPVKLSKPPPEMASARGEARRIAANIAKPSSASRSVSR